MKISTKTRYGTRFLLHLALNNGAAPVPISEIARRQGISRRYLGNIAAALKSAGIVKTAVGAGGGFMLALPPGRITLADVFAAFEGGLELVHCVHNSAACKRAPDCVARDIWRDVNASLEKSMKSVTITDMARKHHAKGAAQKHTGRIKGGNYDF